MRSVRTLIRFAVYVWVAGTLLLVWLIFLARIGVSAGNVTPAWAVVLIPFMLATAFLGEIGSRERSAEKPLRQEGVPVENRRTRA